MFRFVQDLVQKKDPVISGAKKKQEHHTTIGTIIAHPGRNKQWKWKDILPHIGVTRRIIKYIWFGKRLFYRFFL